MNKHISVVFSEMLQKQDRHIKIFTTLVKEVRGSNENIISFFQDQQEISRQVLNEIINTKALLRI